MFSIKLKVLIVPISLDPRCIKIIAGGGTSLIARETVAENSNPERLWYWGQIKRTIIAIIGPLRHWSWICNWTGLCLSTGVVWMSNDRLTLLPSNTLGSLLMKRLSCLS
jgi:hypothetical protein